MGSRYAAFFFEIFILKALDKAESFDSSMDDVWEQSISAEEQPFGDAVTHISFSEAEGFCQWEGDICQQSMSGNIHNYLKVGGILVSLPCTLLEVYTPREHWIRRL
ncbi:MAG TPA: hypothetical protein EYH35_00980 [Thiotrichaceae bacterium]|nr:hypothetical protein [Thiotrichaceae bacterium]